MLILGVSLLNNMFIKEVEVKVSETMHSFDKVWKNYDLKQKRPGDLLGSYFQNLRVKELNEVFKGKTIIINIGSGSGKWSLPFLELGYKVINFDISSYALQLSKKRCESFFTNNVRGNVNALPFKNESFDVVMSFGLLEHFEDIRTPIYEMVRILKPNGLFLADVITKRISVQTFQSWVNFFLYLLYNLIRFDLKKIKKSSWFVNKDYYENSLSEREYLIAMVEAGLFKTNIKGIRCFPLVMLPSCIEKMYVPALRVLDKFFLSFDKGDSKFSKVFGAIWELRGIKRFKNKL